MGESSVAGFVGATHAAARSIEPFRARLHGAGAFPSVRRPRVLWLDVTEGTTECSALAAATDRALAPLGWPPESRPFRAHVTLGRADPANTGARRAAHRLIGLADDLDIVWLVERLILYESITGRGPAEYRPVAEAALGGGR